MLTITGSERIYMIENHPTLYKLSTLPSCLGLLIIPGSWLILTLCDRLILEHEHYENEISLDIYFFFCLNLVFTLGISIRICFFTDRCFLNYYLNFPYFFYSSRHVPESKIWSSATQCRYAIAYIFGLCSLEFQTKLSMFNFNINVIVNNWNKPFICVNNNKNVYYILSTCHIQKRIIRFLYLISAIINIYFM